MSEEGFILTNEHVVRGAEEIQITLYDRRVYQAKLIGQADSYNDLAVLKIDADDLVPAEWGDSDSLEVGSIVWAIGSPYGLDQTVTSGIISAKNRYDRNQPQQELMQTDSAVNPGNSGGPLVDAMGRVVGINTSIYGEQFQGISFAVPSVQAKFVYEETIKKGYVRRGILGAIPTPKCRRTSSICRRCSPNGSNGSRRGLRDSPDGSCKVSKSASVQLFVKLFGNFLNGTAATAPMKSGIFVSSSISRI